MTQQLREHRDQVLRRIAAAPRLFCFLDYDGTLSPIALSPDEALPLPGTAQLLGRLAQAPQTRVAVVTGRSIADVRRFVDVASVHYIGVHGLELQRPGEPAQMSPEAAEIRPLIPQIRKQLETTLGRRDGILLEEKSVAIACHYRLAARGDARAARAAVVRLVQWYRRRGVPLSFIDGHEVTEVRPTSANKGKAAAALLAGYAPALALYIGDDRTDEDAFRRLPADTITVRVGPAGQETAAQYLLGDPVEVQAFLLEVAAVRDR
jgi:trehalose-phosphatase